MATYVNDVVAEATITTSPAAGGDNEIAEAIAVDPLWEGSTSTARTRRIFLFLVSLAVAAGISV